MHFIHNDHVGTPQRVTNEQGEVVWQALYQPFGEADIVLTGVEPSFEFNLRFPGQYFDVETGLHYNYFRYYDPSIGRYMSSDPIGLDGGVNTFGYANANPVYFMDPYGLFGLPALPQDVVDVGYSVQNTVFGFVHGLQNNPRQALDTAGNVPGPAGIAADVGSGAISLSQGDLARAAGSLACAFPIVGELKMLGKGLGKASRKPKSLQDQMTLEAAKRGDLPSTPLPFKLGDPRFKGMEKRQSIVTSNEGNKTVVHFVRDPATGKKMDFKVKKSSID